MVSFFCKSKYVNERAVIQPGFYVDGSPAWQLFSEETGEPLARATVCMVDYGYKPLPEEVFIKTWSENEGILQALIDASIIAKPHMTLDAGFAIGGVAVCQIVNKELLDATTGE